MSILGDVGIDRERIRNIVADALKEDIGRGDLTTELIIPEDLMAKGEIVSKERGMLAGIQVAQMVFEVVDADLKFEPILKDGFWFKKGETIARVHGRARSILAGERVCLNFLSHLCGVATLTYRFVEKVKPYGVKILDTRKTTPLLRYLERYAVRVGGGENHRFDLYDGILIKDNHILKEGLSVLVKRAKERRPPGIEVQVETRNLKEVEEVVSEGPDVIMLDNMDLETIKEAVGFIRERAPHILIEVSGGINLGNVVDVARLGVDRISIGRLTHSFKAVDLSLVMR